MVQKLAKIVYTLVYLSQIYGSKNFSKIFKIPEFPFFPDSESSFRELTCTALINSLALSRPLSPSLILQQPLTEPLKSEKKHGLLLDNINQWHLLFSARLLFRDVLCILSNRKLIEINYITN